MSEINIDDLLDEAADELLVNCSAKTEPDDGVDASLDTLRENEERLKTELVALSNKKGIDISELLHGLNNRDEVSDDQEGDEEEIAKVNAEIMKVLQQLLTAQSGNPQEIMKQLLIRLCSTGTIDEGENESVTEEEYPQEDTDTPDTTTPPSNIIHNTDYIPPKLSRDTSSSLLTPVTDVDLSHLLLEERDHQESLHKAVFIGSFALVSDLLEKESMQYYDV
eukprot:CAMPEP_0182434634 /NCGR_PEP_ID=MMETSP1167-20130531/70935_1 /TAXON_ID=2988 /ORGANISM="Mallomonas Sp, Strain CCMP3275" /LENGTH=221 /DNA_ID=CAMNT_0024624731 /DNA_START=49 /DNA_END=710 /DNA_ORIENTATION=-